MAEDRRETLSQAYDAIAARAEPAVESVTPAPVAGDSTPTSGPAVGATTPAASVRARDEHGRFAPKEGDKPAEKPPESAKAPPSPPAPHAEGEKGKGDGAAAAAVVPPPEPATPKAPEFKPPQSFKPDAREEWAKVPTKVQAEIIRREREIQHALQQAAPEKQFASEIRQVIAPFEASIRATGSTPAQVIDSYMRTGYTLQHGTPQQKAQVAAQIIKNFGVDIGTLDALLSGQAPATSMAADPALIAQQVEQRIRGQLSAEASRAAAERTKARLVAFGEKHEFYDDVRSAMADILAARGKTDATDSELEEVYDLACRVHPEIAGVVKQREAAKQAATSAEATRRAQEAASSIKSQPTATAPAGPQDRRAILSRRYDELAGR